MDDDMTLCDRCSKEIPVEEAYDDPEGGVLCVDCAFEEGVIE